MKIFKPVTLALLAWLIYRTEQHRMTFAEYAAAQAEQQNAVMVKLDKATETIADELTEVSGKVAELEELIRNSGIDEAKATELLAKNAEIGTRVDALAESVENILPDAPEEGE